MVKFDEFADGARKWLRFWGRETNNDDSDSFALSFWTGLILRLS